MRSTPEAAPLSESEELTPPTWQEHMRGPILGTDGLPTWAGARTGGRVFRGGAGSGAGGRAETSGSVHRRTSGWRGATQVAALHGQTGERGALGRAPATPLRSWPRPRSSPSRRSIFPVAGSRGSLATWRPDVRSESDGTEKRRSRSQKAIAEPSWWRGSFAPHAAGGVIQAAKTRPVRPQRRPHLGCSPRLTAV